MAFKALKQNRDSNLAKFAEAAKAGSKSYEDNRFWELTLDKNQSGSAVIRFLPAPDGEDLPFVKTFKRSFKGPTGKWYIENCLSTIGKDDPVGALCSALWNTGVDKDKEKARGMKRKLTYISNILVINDPGNPANNGKVFLFRYGQKVFAKIQDAMEPEFADETPLNPFDFWAGADFKFKCRPVEGYRNYDKSEFADPSELLDGDDVKLEKVYDSLYSLKEFLDEKNFKSYTDLEAKLKTVLGDQALINNLGAVSDKSAEDLAKSEDAPAPGKDAKRETTTETEKSPDADEGDDADISYFKRLAQS